MKEMLKMVIFFVVVAIFGKLSKPVFGQASNFRGYLDAVNSEYSIGWTCWIGSYGVVDVHVYVNGAKRCGLGANQIYRPDIINPAALCMDGQHGFISYWSNCADGYYQPIRKLTGTVTIRAYSVCCSTNKELSNSPVVAYLPDYGNPYGSLEIARRYYLQGWVCDPDGGSALPALVRIYVDNAIYTEIYASGYRADLSGNGCGGYGAWSLNLPAWTTSRLIQVNTFNIGTYPVEVGPIGYATVDFGNDCAEAPCQNGGVCIDGNQAYVCSCPAGWTGTTCLIDVNDCSPNPCQNGGTCSDLGTNSFSCFCLSGWTGGTCASDVNECAVSNGGCHPLTSCLNLVGSRVCGACPTGLVGTGETTCVLEPPQLNSISPLGGTGILSLGVSTVITLFGAKFGNVESNVFATVHGVACPIVPQSLNAAGSEFKCTIPSLSSPPVDVGVGVRKQISTMNEVSATTALFRYITTRPVISTLTPLVGFSGSVITLTGTGYTSPAPPNGPAALSVMFGAARVVGGFTSNTTAGTLNAGSSTLTVIVPALSPGPFSLYISYFSVESLPFSSTFDVSTTVIPTLISASPSGVQDKSIISVLGGAFGGVESSIEVIFAAKPLWKCDVVSGSLSSGIQFSCVFNMSSDLSFVSGDYSMSIKVSSQQSQNSIPIRVVAFPVLASITPTAGTSSEVITIYGSNFPSSLVDMTVTIGNDSCSNLQILVPGSSLACVSPLLSFGTYLLSMTVYTHIKAIPAINASLPSYTFLYPPILYTVSPRGFLNNSVLIITGDDFLPPSGSSSNVVVEIATIPCFIIYIFSSSISCQVIIPASLSSVLQVDSIYDVVVHKYSIMTRITDLSKLLFITPPRLLLVTPGGGTLTSVLTIRGTNLGTSSSNLVVFIGGFNACPIAEDSFDAFGTRLTCTLSSTSLPIGIYDISVKRYDTLGISTVPFVLFDAPAVVDIQPRGGLAGQLVRVIASGLFFNLLNDTKVYIGSTNEASRCHIDLNATLFSVEGTGLFCTAPSVGVTGPLPVSVYVFDTKATSSSLLFEYVPMPVITAISPQGGANKLAEQLLTIYGSNFGADESSLTAIFTPVTNEAESVKTSTPILGSMRNNFFVVRVPLEMFDACAPLNATTPNCVGEFNVTVMKYATPSIVAMPYEVVYPPAIQARFPEGGTAGTIVTITGSWFGVNHISELRVEFRPPSSLIRFNCPIVSTTSAFADNVTYCTVPALQPGVYRLIITRFSSVSSLITDSSDYSLNTIFRYVNPASLLTVVPAGSQPGTITNITITGFGFTPSSFEGATFNLVPNRLKVMIGSTCECTLLELRETFIACQLLPLCSYTAGQTYQLHVFRYDIDNVAPTLPFVLEDPPIITSISPPGGRILSSVLIKGLRFGSTFEDIVVRLAGETLPIISFDTVNQQISVLIILPLNNGTYPLSITRFGSLLATPTMNFEFCNVPQLVEVLPRGGYAGMTLTIYGKWFSPNISDITVRLDTTACVSLSFLYYSADPNGISSVACVTSPSLLPGLHKIFFSNFLIMSENTLDWLLVSNPVVVSILPAGGVSNRAIQISGSGFGVSEGDIYITLIPADTQLQMDEWRCMLIAESLNQAGTRCSCFLPFHPHLDLSSNVTLDSKYLTSYHIILSTFNSPSLILSSSPIYSLIAMPIITAVGPRGIRPGDLLTIRGIDFTPQTSSVVVVVALKKNPNIQRPCAVQESSSTHITCFFPVLDLSTSGGIDVKVTLFGDIEAISYFNNSLSNNTSSSSSEVMFLAQPTVIEAIEPSFATPGQTITITSSHILWSEVATDDISIRVSAGGSAGGGSGGMRRRQDDMSLNCVDIAFLIDQSTQTISFLTCRIDQTSLTRNIEAMMSVSITIFGFSNVAGDGASDEKKNNIFIYNQVKYTRPDLAIVQFFIFLLALSIVCYIALGAFYVYHWKEKLIRSHQPRFSAMTLLGCIMALISVLLFLGKPNTSQCQTQVIVPSLAFITIFGNLFARVWRIYRIFYQTSLKALVIQDIDLAKYVVVLYVVDVILLALFVSFGNPQPSLELIGSDYVMMSCVRDDAGTKYLLLLGFLKLIILIYGVYLAFQTRTVTSEFNESQLIGFSIYNTFFISAVLVPVLITMDDPVKSFIVIATIVLFVVSFIVVSLFAKRIIAIYKLKYGNIDDGGLAFDLKSLPSNDRMNTTASTTKSVTRNSKSGATTTSGTISQMEGSIDDFNWAKNNNKEVVENGKEDDK